MNDSSVSLTCHFVPGGGQLFLHPAERASSCAKTGRSGMEKPAAARKKQVIGVMFMRNQIIESVRRKKIVAIVRGLKSESIVGLARA